MKFKVGDQVTSIDDFFGTLDTSLIYTVHSIADIGDTQFLGILLPDFPLTEYVDDEQFIQDIREGRPEFDAGYFTDATKLIHNHSFKKKMDIL